MVRVWASCTVPLGLFTVTAVKPELLLSVWVAALPTNCTGPVRVAVPLLAKLPFTCNAALAPSVKLAPAAIVRSRTARVPVVRLG